MRSVSIRWRITFWNTAAFMVVLVAFGILVYGLLRQTHYDQLDRSMESRLRAILEDKQFANAPIERIQKWLRTYSRDSGIVGFVIDAGGNTVIATGPPESASAAISPKDIGLAPRFDSLVIPGLGRWRRLAVRVPTTTGDATLIMLAELEHVDEELGLVLQVLMITVPTTLIAAAALSYFLAFKSLVPVERLRRQADDITADRLHQRLPVDNPSDELGMLSRTINSMIARLEHSFDEVRRFTADASHELRTPITVIRSEAELGIDECSDADGRCRFESILEECGRLASATNQLLALSREDAGVAVAGHDPVELKPLLLECIDTIGSKARAKHQRIVTELDADIAVIAAPERLRQVFHNLLDNAVKYTLPKGQLEVSLLCEGSDAVVTVRDNGIGIPPEHIPHIFDRFYRVDKNGSTIDGGAGLGLSIVASILSSLGGRVEVDSVTGHGTTFRVSLPIAS